MSELEILQGIGADVDSHPEARGRVRSRLVRKIDETERRPRRVLPKRWLLAPAAAAAVCGAVIVSTVGGGEAETASAAVALRGAAEVARGQSAPSLRPGEYVYTRSDTSGLVTYDVGKDGLGGHDGPTYSALLPTVRETWVAPDGSGWERARSSGAPRFLSERDRARWTADGAPELGETTDEPLPKMARLTRPGEPQEPAHYEPMYSLGLPTNPDQLYGRLEHDARGDGYPVNVAMFDRVRMALAESYTSPELRAALYEVAARIPGVELLGEVSDPAGRPGVGVTIDSPADNARLTLIFDPDTSALLAERQTLLEPTASYPYPADTAVHEATYLENDVVDHAPAHRIH